MAPPKGKDGLSFKIVMKSTPPYIQSHAGDKVVKSVKFSKSKLGRKACVAEVVKKMNKVGERVTVHKCSVIGKENDGPLSAQKCMYSCDCESFMYQAEYALTQYGAAKIKFSDGSPAHTTNPGNVPLVCSHLYRLLARLLKQGK